MCLENGTQVQKQLRSNFLDFLSISLHCLAFRTFVQHQTNKGHALIPEEANVMPSII